MEEIQRGEMFLCFAYEPNDPSVNKKQILRDMDKYWAEQNRKYLVTSLSRCTTLGRFRVPTPMDCLKATYGLAQST